MYYPIIQQLIRSLKNLDGFLKKATQYAEVKKFDPDVFVSLRLAPDMFACGKQVQVACDTAKACAAVLAQREAPKHEDTETTVVQLRARIAKCVSYLETFKDADFKDVSASTRLKLPHPAGKGMLAEDYCLSRALPNHYFHVCAVYMILRSHGVDLGKMDYLGELRFFDVT